MVIQSLSHCGILFISFCILCFANVGYSQSTTDLSLQVQVYPTGIIPGITFDKSISDKGRIGIRLGYNTFDHRDLGVHTDEEGGGFGFSFGYQYYFKENFTRWHLELKNDVWFNHIDWSDLQENDRTVDGETDIIVLQPTFNIGYTFLTSSNIVIRPILGIGWEWNVKTDGEPTGEGAIGLMGISIGKRF